MTCLQVYREENSSTSTLQATRENEEPWSASESNDIWPKDDAVVYADPRFNGTCITQLISKLRWLALISDTVINSDNFEKVCHCRFIQVTRKREFITHRVP